jgi:hypothetical protein
VRSPPNQKPVVANGERGESNPVTADRVKEGLGQTDERIEQIEDGILEIDQGSNA